MKYFILLILFIISINGCTTKHKNISSHGNDSASHQKNLAKDAYKELK